LREIQSQSKREGKGVTQNSNKENENDIKDARIALKGLKSSLVFLICALLAIVALKMIIK